MRLIITADLHFNHPRSRTVAEELIERINAAGGDVLLLVGDTAAADGDALEQCLSRFRWRGPKLFVPGNHELWTHGPDSHHLLTDELPRRLRGLGWQWLQVEPFVQDELAIIGSVGWYDYSFAQPALRIPRRFYEHKISPGAAARLEQFAPLLERGEHIPESARAVTARWNDGRFVKLHRPDEVFLQELLEQMERQLDSLRGMSRIIAAVHHLPFRELLPPPHGAQWDFAKAYLGSERIGRLLLRYDNVRHLYCGHSHLPAQARIGQIDAVNIGSGYRWKTFHTLDL